MIHHISFSVNKPQHAAATLALFWKTKALPFPMYEDSFVVFFGERTGSCIELYPAGTRLEPSSPELPGIKSDGTQNGGSFHAAISVPLETEEIMQICQDAGWFCQTGPRGGLFSVVEVWVENHTLLELLTPEMTADYQANISMARWQELLADK